MTYQNSYRDRFPLPKEIQDDEDDVEEDDDDEEPKVETQVSIRRACPCKDSGNDTCIFCNGEQWVAHWISLEFEDGSAAISEAEIDELFIDLTAYQTLFNKGYRVIKEKDKEKSNTTQDDVAAVQRS